VSLSVLSLVVPKNTPIYKPVQLIYKPTVRRVMQVQAVFPPGCLGTVGIRISDYDNQFFPDTDWLTGDGETVTSIENLMLTNPPRIVIEGYSTAEDWQHIIQIRLYLTQ